MDNFVKKHLEAAQATFSLYVDTSRESIPIRFKELPNKTGRLVCGEARPTEVVHKSSKSNITEEIKTSTAQRLSEEIKTRALIRYQALSNMIVQNESKSSMTEEPDPDYIVIREGCLKDIERGVDRTRTLYGFNVQTFDVVEVRISEEHANLRLRFDIEDEHRYRRELVQLLQSPTPSAQRIVQLTAAYLHCATHTSYAFFKTIKSTDTERDGLFKLKVEKDLHLRRNLKLLVEPGQHLDTLRVVFHPDQHLEPTRIANQTSDTECPQPPRVNSQNPQPSRVNSQNPQAVEYLETLRVVMMQRAAGRHRVAELKPPLNEFYAEVYREMLEKDVDTIVRGEPFRAYSCLYSIPDFNWLISNPNLAHTRTNFEHAIDSELAKRAKYDLDIPLVRRFRDILVQTSDEFVYLEGSQLWKKDLAEGKGDKEYVLGRIAFMEPHEVKFEDLEKEATTLYARFLSLPSPFYRALTAWTPRQIFSNRNFIDRLIRLCNSVCD